MLEIRKVFRDHSPDDFYIDTQVVVNKHIAKRRQCRPLYLRMSGLQFSGDSLCRFGHGVEVAENGILMKRRGYECGLPAGRGLCSDGIHLTHVH